MHWDWFAGFVVGAATIAFLDIREKLTRIIKLLEQRRD